MKFKHVSILKVALLVMPLLVAGAVVQATDKQAEAKKLAEDILSRMTLEEKVSLCRGNSTMTVNAIPRVGLKEEFTMSDGPHNVRPELKRENFSHAGRNDDYSTSLPSLSALAATWDVDLATLFGNTLGSEARERGKDMILGPGVNIQRTPLCGRNFEYMGEDPVLASRMAVNLIKAIQSNDVAACVKHFAANNMEWNRTKVDSVVDERTLREIYLPAFEAAVREAGVLSVMSGFNQFRGTFCSHNDYLNNKILKEEWQFPGFVVTDWGSLHDTVGGALGGTDLEMNAGKSIRYFKQPLLDAVKSGAVPEAVIDDKVRRILYAMAMVDKLSDKPRKTGARNTKEHQEAARKIAESAIVLMKNDRGILPLSKKDVGNVVVVGQNAVTKHCREGWSAEGKPPYEVTPLDGLRSLLGEGVTIDYFPIEADDVKARLSQIPDSALVTVDTTANDTGMTIKAWKARYYNNTELAGEPAFTGFDRHLDFNWKGDAPKPSVNGTNFSARWEGVIVAPESGTYTFGITSDDGARLTIGGNKVIDHWEPSAGETRTGEIELKEGAIYTVEVEYFQGKGESRFMLGWQLPSERGAADSDMVAKVKKADAVIIFTGTRHGHGRALECEGGDRPNMKLPEGHDAVIRKLLPLNDKTVVVNLSGAPVEMPWVEDAPALVQYWYAGQEGGNALAGVLFGDVNPSGKLPFTFPVKLEDSPAHALNDYNDKKVMYKEGVFVGYRWFDEKNIAPMFPFGHGLSYTTFEIGKPELNTRQIGADGTVKLKATVRNIGKVAGSEVVQLYVSDLEASVPRPPRELKAFRKAFLRPGESVELEFELSPRDFSFWNEKTNGWTVEPGAFELQLGTSSRDIRQKAVVNVK